MTVRFVRRPGAALEFLRWQALVQQQDGSWLMAASASSPGKLLSQLAAVLLERCEADAPRPEGGPAAPDDDDKEASWE